MAHGKESKAVRIARDYYNSADADLFYREVWGGEDIHVGLYAADDEDIALASRRTVQHMAELGGPLDADSKVIDLGAGYGGSMRYVAETFGSHCVAVNLSDVENERSRRLTREAGLEDRIEVIEADFASLDFPDATFDLAWSQEALLHSDARERVCAEAARVLKRGGRFVFTDPMKTDKARQGELEAIYDRLNLDSLASPRFYRETLIALGLREIVFEERAEQLALHYARVREVLVERSDRLRDLGMSDRYADRMKAGLQYWVDGARQGILTWGIFVFEKR